MPRPLIKNQNVQQTATPSEQRLSLDPLEKQNAATSNDEKIMLDRQLRKKRSKEYLNAVKQLDAGGHVNNKAIVDEIVQTIADEFPELDLGGLLIGIVAICYLGEPYEVHSLDYAGRIIVHYQKGQPLPGSLEKARGIAIRGGYEFIEVYVDCCRAVSSNGNVSVIK